MDSPRDKLTVLIADDSPEVRIRLQRAIQELPNVGRVLPASDGGQALELHRRERPQAALIDVQMPIVPGCEVVRRIRVDDRHCLLVVLTNDDAESTRTTCLAAGANHFFHKASDFERAIAAIGEFGV